MSPEPVGVAGSTADAEDRGVAAPHFRLPPATHIGVVRLQVADIARSLAYYERVLGFRVVRRGDSVAVLGSAGDDSPIIELRERPGARPHPRRGQLGLFHFAILLPDRPSLGRFLRHLSDIGAYAGMSDHLVSEALYLTDPDGLGIEVYADRPRADWRYAGRELQMATIPLNVQDLVAAAGSERWAGMPNGTRIGHVHLHVGDLDRAAAFYHDALGFDKVVWSYPGALFLSAGGYHHHLGTNTWAAGAQAATDEDARLIEWELVMPDAASVSAAAGSVEAAGGTVERSKDGTVLAHDPWGTAVRLVAADGVANPPE
ncbi:MAG TPA: VOC family protein [Gemmatimonadaceae bacterium]|nr:VOC family protein [Gemmatimonadaceae bacterium]